MIDLSPEFVTILMFVGILAGPGLGHPVAFVLGGTGDDLRPSRMGALEGWYLFMGRTFDSTTNNILIAIPLFILMASFLGRSGISDGSLPGDDVPLRPDERRHRAGRHRHVRH